MIAHNHHLLYVHKIHSKYSCEDTTCPNPSHTPTHTHSPTRTHKQAHTQMCAFAHRTGNFLPKFLRWNLGSLRLSRKMVVLRHTFVLQAVVAATLTIQIGTACRQVIAQLHFHSNCVFKVWAVIICSLVVWFFDGKGGPRTAPCSLT